MRRTDCVYRPTVTLFMSDECADANNRVVDVLWELVPECLSDFLARFARETIGSSITRNIGHGFKVPNDDVLGCHVPSRIGGNIKIFFIFGWSVTGD